MRGVICVSAILCGAALAWAGSKAEELRELQEKLGDRGLVGDWIYDDVDEAFTVARRTGKPIFLVFR